MNATEPGWTHQDRMAWLVVLLATTALMAVGCGASPTSPTSAPASAAAAAVKPGAAGTVSEIQPAAQQNLTPDNFSARGWECRNSPVPGRVACSPPNQGFPAVPPPADRPPSFTLKIWESAGCSLTSLSACSYAGNLLLLHPDVYNNQRCDSTGQPFIWRPVIGYYECLHATGS